MSTIIHETSSHPAWCNHRLCQVTASLPGDIVAHVAETVRTRVVTVDGPEGPAERWAEIRRMQWADEDMPFVVVEEHVGDQVVVTSYRATGDRQDEQAAIQLIEQGCLLLDQTRSLA